MIDSHAHIYLEHFKEDLDEVVMRAIDSGVEKILLPNIDADSIDDMLELEDRYPEVCYSMMGLHPCSVKEDFEQQLLLVEEWLGKRPFIAVGEMGTDLYWDKSFWEQQKEAFHFQCRLALKHQLPIVIHCRDSINETIEMVEEYEGQNLKGVFHCFTGSLEQADRIIRAGFHLGLGGVSTFKNGGMHDVIPHLNKEKVLLETDSPYLTPTPNRGKRNEPSYTKLVALRVAELWEMELAEVDAITAKNTNQLFFPN